MLLKLLVRIHLCVIGNYAFAVTSTEYLTKTKETETLRNNMTNSLKSYNTTNSNDTESQTDNQSGAIDAEEIEVNKNPDILNYIDLENLNTNMTSRLIEEKISIEDVADIGVSLQDLVAGECGGSRVCERGEEANDTITIGFLGAYALNPTVLGALPLAVAAVNREPTLLPGRQLRFVTADIGRPRRSLNRDSLSLRVMTQMRDMGVAAFFGLDDTCSTEAKLAAAWNLPLISHKCAAAEGARHDTAGLGGTFARTLPPAYKISKSVVALLKKYGWTKFAIISGDAPTAGAQQMEAIKELAHVQGLTVTHVLSYTDYLPKKIAEMEALVEQSYRTTRIYVFLGESLALGGLVSVLRRRGLLAEYAVVAVDDEIYQPGANSYSDVLGQSSGEDFLAFRAVLKLTPSFPSNPHYSELCEMVLYLSAQPPFCVPDHHKLFQKLPVQIEAAHLYDAVTLWARAATAAIHAGLDVTEGAAVMALLRPTTYSSVQGFDVYMDEAGDAEGNLTVTGLVRDTAAPAGWAVRPVASFRYTNRSDALPELVGGDNISWISGSPPLPEPSCGFDGAKCASLHDSGLWSAAAAAGAVVVLVLMLARHYRYEQKLASVLWKIDTRDLTFISSVVKGHPEEARRSHTTIALHRGNVVAYKSLSKKSVDITRAVKKELKEIRELRHENLNQFIGVCIDSGSACIVTAYCSRGSLARVLADRDLHLDDMFVASLAADLLRGLTYLHDSPLVSHGNLTSSNCLVDSRWVLQISDFGLHNLKSGCANAEDALRSERRMLWRAPELLRDPNHPPRGSQRGDVYSFGIILYEILGRNGPWGLTNLTNSQIIGRVRQPIDGVIFRPSLQGLTVRPSVLGVLSACWSERPDRRPDLRLVRLRLKDMHAGMKTNIFDNMVAMMERYTANLEGVVAERTDQLLDERRKTGEMLRQMLPSSIAEAVQRGERILAQSHDSVTVCQTTVAGISQLSNTFTAAQIIDILNELHNCLDTVLRLYNVEKVDTIDGSNTVVSGMPGRGAGAGHATEAASLALHVLDAVNKIQGAETTCLGLRLRIGIDSGPCSAGVIGTPPRYCVFGASVETATRLAATAAVDHSIHVSQRTYILLRDKGYQFTQKGKGEAKSWLLAGGTNKRKTVSKSRLQNSTETMEISSAGASTLDILDSALRSCGALGPPSPPRRGPCACVVPPRGHHSAPAVTFYAE